MYITIEQALQEAEQALDDAKTAFATLKVVLLRESPEEITNQGLSQKELMKLFEMSEVRL